MAFRMLQRSRPSSSLAAWKPCRWIRSIQGKGLAGLIALLRVGRWRRHDHVVFIHTGGAPALFAYREVLNL